VDGPLVDDLLGNPQLHIPSCQAGRRVFRRYRA
jgi:hypothetical protein